jgi:hypothetical protein
MKEIKSKGSAQIAWIENLHKNDNEAQLRHRIPPIISVGWSLIERIFSFFPFCIVHNCYINIWSMQNGYSLIISLYI